MNASRRTTARRVILASVPVAGLVAVLLLLRGCPDPKPDAEYLFVPRDLAGLRGLDRDGVLNYCRAEVRPADYPGVLRGAHGALWAGEANAWDRVLLAAAALGGQGIEAKVVPGEPPRLAYHDGGRWATVRLDADEPPQTAAEPPGDAIPPDELAAKRPEVFHQIQPVLVLERDGGQAERVQPPQPEYVAEWARQQVFLEAKPAGDGVMYALRVGPREVFHTSPLSGIRRAVLELTWQYGDRSETWTRELFDAENARPEIPGRASPRAGDRYAIAVAAGPLVPDVLATRVRMMELPTYTPEADEAARQLVTAATKYQVDCDDGTRALAAECEVRVSWPRPRVTIAASEVAASGSPGLSLDALADAVEADGPRGRDFHVARGLANDLIETRGIYEATGRPVVSTSTVFSNFKADAANAPARRVAAIQAEAERVLKAEPVGASVTFASTLPPHLTDGERQRAEPGLGSVRLERTAAGLTLHGLARKDGGRPNEPWTGYEWSPDGSAAFTSPAELALVADGMVSRKLGRTDHVLAAEVRSGWPLDQLPVVEGSLLTYKARVGGKDHRLAVLVKLKNGVPGGTWFDTATGKGGELAGDWPEVLTAGPQMRSYLADRLPAEGEATRVKVRVGSNEREVEGRKVAVPGGSAMLLPSAAFPLVLGWQRGEDSLALESASPVVRGRVRDAGTGQPVRASVAMTRKAAVPAPPADLRTWAQQGDRNHGRWAVTADGSAVTQQDGGDPSFFVGPGDLIDATARFRVRTGVPGSGFFGFVLGYRSPLREVGHGDHACEFLLFDWKRTAEQGAKEGLTLSRVKGTFAHKPGAAGLPSPYRPGFWEHKDSESFRALATKHGRGTGWKTKTEYEVEVQYFRDRLRVAIDGELVFDLQDQKFEPGRFGFYTYRAFGVTFSDFRVGPVRTRVVEHRTDERPAAADGTFAQPVLTRPQRLLLVVDRSGSMVATLDPKSKVGPRDTPPPKDQQRVHFLRQAVHRLLGQLPSTVEVALWSFTTGPIDRDPDSPRHVREECPYTTDHARVRAAIDGMKPDGGTPLTGAVRKIVGHLKENPLSRDAVVVLLTDGENSDDSATLAEVYRREGGVTPIHTIGFAIEPKGRAERDLQGLAQASRGTYRIAGTGEDLRLAFGRVAGQFPAVDLAVRSSCHAPADLHIPGAELGLNPRDVRLSHGCAACKCSDKALLTVTRETVAKLAGCDGLSPKARRMIEERVRGGAWRVTIPTRRVNVGRVSAYAWWEVEAATGRMVGRTEDGLHGSDSGNEENWPELEPPSGFDAAGKLPFVAWYHGVVAHATGSVLAAMRWHKSPGFGNGTREDFVRFVQANSLVFTARWWGEVGSGAFGENVNSYWSGVCLSFALQSLATRMPSIACHREWAYTLCDQAAEALKDLPGDKAKEAFDENFGEEYRKLYDEARKYQKRLEGIGAEPDNPVYRDVKLFFDELDRFRKGWEEGVDKGLNCDRLRDPTVTAAASPGS